MKIFVCDPEERTKKSIRIPSALLYSRGTAAIISLAVRSKFIYKYVEYDLSPEALKLIRSTLKNVFKVLRKTKKKYPNFTLIDVETSSGEKVIITL